MQKVTVDCFNKTLFKKIGGRPMDDNLPTFYINCYNCLQIVFRVQILGCYGSMQEPRVC